MATIDHNRAAAERAHNVLVNDSLGDITVNAAPGQNPEQQVLAQILGRRILHAGESTDITEELITAASLESVVNAAGVTLLAPTDAAWTTVRSSTASMRSRAPRPRPVRWPTTAWP